MVKTIILATVIFLCLLRTGWAQETTGHLAGRILDEQGQAISEANIIVTSPHLQGKRGAATNKEGHFRIIALSPGFYTVEISHIAYVPTTLQRVPVRLGKTTSLGEIHLHSRVLELPAVEVSGEKPIIDPVSTTTGANLQLEIIDTLPVDRNFRAIAELIPQANTSYYEDTDRGRNEQVNISGSTGPANAYFIDGVNTTDPYTASFSTNLPYNFIREIEIKTGGYEAEYGRSLGGIINVVTPAGSNEFHGQVFGFFTNNELGGRPRIGLQDADALGSSTYDFGLSLSGPIVHDRLWFHAAYNPNFERQQFRISGLGTLTDKQKSHLFAGKLTWRAPGNTDIIFSLFGDPSIAHLNQLPLSSYPGYTFETEAALARRKEQGGVNVSLQARRVVGQNLLLATNLAYVSLRNKDVADTEFGRDNPLIVDHRTGIFSGGFNTMNDAKSSRFSAKISSSLFMENHELKIGIEYEDNFLDIVSHNPPLVIYSDSLYLLLSFSAAGRVHNQVPTLFLQDSWQATRKLRLNAGLRWDGQYFIGADGKLAQRITNQFQPRVGVIYQPGELGTAKIFGSFGRFYEQIPTNLSNFVHTNNEFTLTFFDHNPFIDPSGGDILDISSAILPEVEDLQGQYFDEFILGYERAFGNGFKIAFRGIYRTLRQAVEDGVDPETNELVYGNPGRGRLDFFPKMKREYQAMEISLQRFTGGRFNFITSYVLSRNSGNYAGLYNADAGYASPNAGGRPDFQEQIPKSDGLLPNDRPHVFKFSGSYFMDMGLTIGASLIWQSGTPISELGTTLEEVAIFLSERGSVGRTPAIADLNLRLKYDLSNLSGMGFQPTLILDAFHLFNQRKAVRVDQTHSFGIDEGGNPVSLNPNYLNPAAFFPARLVRLGIEVNF
jgi:hypothetical protein